MFIQRASLEAPMAPAMLRDQCKWKGFCEIESEPALFNSMLRGFRVDGVRVEEVISLDPTMLVELSRPVYGLIFLFKWTDEDPGNQEQSCPENVWFANQTASNACASVALLNIVNNIPDLELGQSLGGFKRFTTDFSPALRGDAISNFDFIRDVHNSFARKMDMLNADLVLKNEATSKSRGNKNRAGEDESDAGFHFIAFVPINGKLWKLDGLKRQPMCLGLIVGKWLEQAATDIQDRMEQHPDHQVEFSILALVKDPLLSLLPELAQNVKAINALSTRLDMIQSGWAAFTITDEINTNQSNDCLVAADAGLGLDQDMIERASLANDIVDLLSSDSVVDIWEHRVKLVTVQQQLTTNIQEKIQFRQWEDDRADARSCDFGAKMHRFAQKVMEIEGAKAP